ncbi:MAG: TonB-dependent receptor [Saprospiraceae bacterium]|nr:TonB-dependent receptor [Saprospiraceae bacterium]
MKKNFFAILFSFFTVVTYAQISMTLSGVVKDGGNGETLIGATVFVPEFNTGTVTNEYGFYSITLNAVASDTISVEMSYVGFQNQINRVKVQSEARLDVELGTGVALQEVVIKANSYNEVLKSTEMSVETLNPKEAKLIPVLLGESDILKTIQLKPGIPSGSEGSTGLYVRGGRSDQNLIVLDEAVIYNASHLFGFFSTFNTDAVKDLKLYKGGFPSQYGGRLSSVIDVKLKEGNKKKFEGAGGIGLISSKLTLEGPIKKDKSSFIVSGRRTYFDLITNAINESNADDADAAQIPGYYFYDLNTKINFDLSDKDRLYLSGYFGRDVFNFSSDFFNFNFGWGNATGTARWNHQFNPKLFSNTTVTFSDYQYEITNEVTGFSFEVGSRIKDLNLKSDFYWALNSKHTLRYGVGATYHQFEVGRLQAGSDDVSISFNSGSDFDAMEFGAYIGDEWDVSDRLRVNGGLRLSAFSNDNTLYSGLEPRLAARYLLTDNISLKASYARMKQYLHLVASSGVSLPTDIWYPSTAQIEPQRSDQVAVGATFKLWDKFLFTNEYYYKWLDNQVDFVDWAELFANQNLEQEFAIGKGYSYGTELGLEKREGKLTGWIGYTLAWTKRGDFVPVDPNGYFGEGTKYFAPRYDRRHDISVVAMWEITKRLTFSSSWVYGSGDLAWLPTGRLTFQDVQGGTSQVVLPVYRERNNFRLAAFHRLDLGLIWKFYPKWGESDLSLNVINAYDRRNAFFLFLEPEFAEDATPGGEVFEIPERIKATQVSLFPILPSLTWNFKF